MSNTFISCQSVREQLPALALNALESTERDAILAHVKQCADCSAALSELETVSFGLSDTLPTVPPPTTLRAKILAAASETPQARRFSAAQAQTMRSGAQPARSLLQQLRDWLARPTVLLRLAASLAVLVALIGGATLLSRPDQRQQIIAGRTRAVALKGTENAPGAQATMSLGSDDRSAVLDVSGLPPLQTGKAYCAWLVYDGGKARDMGALFEVDANGAAQVLINAPRSLAGYGRFTVTIEDAGTTPSKPTGPRVLSS